MGGNQARLEYNTRCEKYMKGLFAEVTMKTDLRAMALITTSLEGPFEVGYRNSFKNHFLFKYFFEILHFWF